MKVWLSTPYDLEKNLGKAYNEFMQLLPDDDWACLMDYDVQLLTPDAVRIIHTYVDLCPNAGILTCRTNRASTLSFMQLHQGVVNENPDITWHITLAERYKANQLYNISIIPRDISGFLMVISKKLWKEINFTEDKKCLGVDTEFNRRVRSAGHPIYLMDGLYCFHQYRIMNGIHNKKHLL
jgi:GT2 family glycosyltransferase